MAPREIRFQGQSFPVSGTRRVSGREYLLLRRLNSRDQEVWLAFDRRAGLGGNLRVLQTLPRSARATQLLQILSRQGRLHQALPTLVDVERGTEQYTLVTNWVAGIDLAQHLALCRSTQRRPRRHYSPYMAFSFFRRFVHGLSQLHDYLQVVHGDLAPENVILSSQPQQWVLVDFGSAWQEPRATKRHDGDGRREFYAAPELRAPEAMVDERSDQFSATLVFYEFLTQELPFEGLGAKAAWPEFVAEFHTGPIPASERLNFETSIPRAVWPKIDALIARGLAFRPADRFPTDAAWRDAIDEIQLALHQQVETTGWNRLLLTTLERAANWLRPRGRAELREQK